MRRAVAVTLSLLLTACATPAVVTPVALACPQPGDWLEPTSGARPSHQAVLAQVSQRPVVLLGETHDHADHHRWQLQLLAGLYALRPDLVIGFEAFPRSAQPVLDRWKAGDLSEEAMLEESRWDEIWGFDPGLYLPLLHFARMHRIPLVALNVERDLVRQVGKAGWDAVPVAEREGLSPPRPPAEGYIDSLLETYRQHRPDPDDPSIARDDPAFRRFVAAQQVWDRAVAEALAAARQAADRPLVVGLIGQGHLAYGHGVPWQLADLGIEGAAVLLPFEPGEDCAAPPAGLADALFVIAPPQSED